MFKVFLSIILSTITTGCVVQSVVKQHEQSPKNIILLIGDGMGPAHIKAYRHFMDNPNTPEIEALFLDNYLIGTVATDPDQDSHFSATKPASLFVITDSASSANAYSTGNKTTNGFLGLSPKKESQLTALELAKQKGKKTGLVATSQITHATPAAFIAHVDSRKKYSEIADSFVDNQWQGQPVIDVFLGGGVRDFKRTDRDLTAELKQFGFEVITSKSELENTGSKVAGLFADVAFPSVLEREKHHPSLVEMTNAAINKLNNNNGFFLMVEGSQIDWASHDNDLVGMLNEMKEFEAAVKAAIDFAQKDGNTLVLITADHETGGLSVGAQYSEKATYYYNLRAVSSLKRSLNFYANEIAKSKNIEQFLDDAQIVLTDKQFIDWQALEKEPNKIRDWLIKLINKQTNTGWTTTGHTGVDVNLYGFGPGSSKLIGHHDNTEIGKYLLNVL